LEVEYRGMTRLVRDPLNPKIANDPYGANSVCHATGYQTPDWTQHDPEAREGTLEETSLQSQAFGDERTIQVYLPARLRAASRYPARGRPKDRGLMGASLGAVASFHAAWRHPGVFGNLLLQSGSFAFTDIGKSRRSPAMEPVVAFVNEFRAAPAKTVDRVFVS